MKKNAKKEEHLSAKRNRQGTCNLIDHKNAKEEVQPHLRATTQRDRERISQQKETGKEPATTNRGRHA
jgi:hypothetical protein